MHMPMFIYILLFFNTIQICMYSIISYIDVGNQYYYLPRAAHTDNNQQLPLVHPSPKTATTTSLWKCGDGVINPSPVRGAESPKQTRSSRIAQRYKQPVSQVALLRSLWVVQLWTCMDTPRLSVFQLLWCWWVAFQLPVTNIIIFCAGSRLFVYIFFRRHDADNH